jgi:hypothetical protein
MRKVQEDRLLSRLNYQEQLQQRRIRQAIIADLSGQADASLEPAALLLAHDLVADFAVAGPMNYVEGYHPRFEFDSGQDHVPGLG